MSDMKLTKAALAKIIKEVVEDEFRMDLTGPDDERFTSPDEPGNKFLLELFYKIKEIVDTAAGNKSLGFRPDIANTAVQEIADLLQQEIGALLGKQ